MSTILQRSSPSWGASLRQHRPHPCPEALACLSKAEMQHLGARGLPSVGQPSLHAQQELLLGGLRA